MGGNHAGRLTRAQEVTRFAVLGGDNSSGGGGAYNANVDYEAVCPVHGELLAATSLEGLKRALARCMLKA